MKGFVKVLSLYVLLMLVAVFSVFGATKSEKASSITLSDGTVVKVEKDFNGKVKRIQFPNGERFRLNNIQSLLNIVRTKCSKLINGVTVDACRNAKIAVALAVAAAGLACATAGPWACALASAAAMEAVRLMGEACGSSYMDEIGIDEGLLGIEAKNRKLFGRKSRLQFQP